VFSWVLRLLAEKGLLKGQTLGIDATTLEANAALRTIVRRDTGEGYQDFLKRLAQESGIATPTREQLARLDRKRKHKGSNEEWKHPHDPDARITKMKDGRTHLAHKVEHAVDFESGAVVAVNLAAGDAGDTKTVGLTVAEAGEQIATVAGEPKSEGVNPEGPKEVVLDKGYHSNEVLVELAEWQVRTYCSEPERGRRRWEGKAEEQVAVYANRRRIRGERGEKLERSFAHLYETGGMRRVDLRRDSNILKRLLVHVAAFNLGLVMRQKWGRGTPRGLQGHRLDLFLGLLRLLNELWALYLGSKACEECFEPNFGSPKPSNDTFLATAKKDRFYHGLLVPKKASWIFTRPLQELADKTAVQLPPCTVTEPATALVLVDDVLPPRNVTAPAVKEPEEPEASPPFRVRNISSGFVVRGNG